MPGQAARKATKATSFKSAALVALTVAGNGDPLESFPLLPPSRSPALPPSLPPPLPPSVHLFLPPCARVTAQVSCGWHTTCAACRHDAADKHAYMCVLLFLGAERMCTLFLIRMLVVFSCAS